MKLFDAHLLAYQLMDEHGLVERGWTFEFDRAKTRFGVCYYNRKQIKLSKVLTVHRDESSVRNTILHEIAHALVGHGHGHNHVWRRKALEIGCNAERVTDDENLNKISPETFNNYVGICPNGHRAYRSRLTERAKRMSCGKCSSVYNPQYKFEWERV